MAKVFQILVPDNTLVSRVISCENQVSELFVIERSDKQFVSDFESDLKKPALYILANRDTKELYVGETDDSLKRLKNHEAKDFWTEAIVFHSTSDTLSTTEVKWLEAKTYEVLRDLGYYDLSHNKVTPQYPKLKRNQIYTLEPVFEEAKNYICAAGFDIFLKNKFNKEEVKSDSDNTATVSSQTFQEPYLSKEKKIPGYYTAVRGKFIQNILLKLGKSGNIFEITSLNELEVVRKEVAKEEKKLGRHNEYSCSISQLKHYIESGLSYKEFEFDAKLVKQLKKQVCKN